MNTLQHMLTSRHLLHSICPGNLFPKSRDNHFLLLASQPLIQGRRIGLFAYHCIKQRERVLSVNGSSGGKIPPLSNLGSMYFPIGFNVLQRIESKQNRIQNKWQRHIKNEPADKSSLKHGKRKSKEKNEHHKNQPA